MSQPTLEELEHRVQALEETVACIVGGRGRATTKDWKSTIGMFKDDPVMAEIQEEARMIREKDREAARHDLDYDFG